MSTITTKTHTNTDTMLAEIGQHHADMQRDYAAMLDYRDTPGSWTQRQKGAYEERRNRYPQFFVLCGTLSEQITKAVAMLATMTPQRDRMRAAKATIEQMIKDAPDYREIVDSRASTAEWARQNGLSAALVTIDRGCEYFGGAPALPGPLRALLTDICPHCGDAKLKWFGPLEPLEEAIVEAERQLSLVPGSIAALREGMKTHLTVEPILS